MRKLFYLLLLLPVASFAQTNMLRDTGNIGIGTTTPTGKLQVYDNGRNYYVNRAIIGETAESTGVTFILLHKIYTNALLNDSYVSGKITATRGSTGSWNRKWTVEVNTASAYNTTRGSIISYNEPVRLVTLVYGGVTYVAAEIANTSAMKFISFTGYAGGESLTLVYHTAVSNVQLFTSFDPVTIHGRVAIGTTLPSSSALTVAGTVVARQVKVTQGAWPDYVFEPGYELPSLREVESYVKVNKHLPDVPSAAEVEKDGLDLGEMNKVLLQKVEELTLYLIDAHQKNKKLEGQVEILEQKMTTLINSLKR